MTPLSLPGRGAGGEGHRCHINDTHPSVKHNRHDPRCDPNPERFPFTRSVKGKRRVYPSVERKRHDPHGAPTPAYAAR